MRKTSKKGFTLTELLIVIAILAIMAAVSVPIISGLINKGTNATEDVNAVLYTSIMNKYASTEPEKATAYPRLTTTGTNSEYALFAAKSGQGTFPGFNIIAGTSDADVLNKIRKEAVIAIKAYSDTAVSDEYFIPPPADAEYEYVYYYLTGNVKKVKRTDLRTTTASQILTGVVNVEDYWVYLSREGGSGAALGGVSNGTGHVFVQVTQFGTGVPIDNAQVTVVSGAQSFTATTGEGQNGFVGFSGVPVGSVTITVSAQGAVTFPNSEFYNKTGQIFISESGYEGCQMNSPYKVELKLGSLGSLGFYEENVIWNSGAWDTRRELITGSVTATSQFNADNSNPGGFPRTESYSTNLYETGGTQALLTGSKFLTYGNYNLLVSAYGYRTYQNYVTAGVYGIDDDNHLFSGMSSPYEFPIVMRSPAGQGTVSGVIEYESMYQPLRGTPSGITGTWVYADNYYVYSRVKLTNLDTGTAYYSNYLTADSNGKHSYSIAGLPDGTYSFEIDSPYRFSGLNAFPDYVTIDGRHVVISGKVTKSDVSTGSLTGTVKYNYLGNNDPIPGATVTIKRNGDSSASGTCTTSDEGKFTLSNLKNGFYQLEISLPSTLGGETYKYRCFVSGNNSCTIALSISQIEISGTVTPYMTDDTAQSKSGTLDDLTIAFVRTNSNGTKQYSSISATVDATGVEAAYSVNLVPGYYEIDLTSICYVSLELSSSNYNVATTKNFSMTVDTDGSNHVGFTMESDSSKHWDECTNCGYKCNSNSHSVSDWTYYSASYCYRYCTVCDYWVDDLTSHQMTSYVSTAASCTSDGVRTYYCSRGCGYTYNDIINKTGHRGNGVWVYDNNGSSTSLGTHHQNCSNCGATIDANTACSRGGMINNGGNHYDNCSKCSGKRYFNHSWIETSRSGATCTGGTIYYKCSGCAATTTGSYAATASHNFTGKCSVKHSCSWTSYCSAGGTHKWTSYYHILCTRCAASDSSQWCGIHCGSNKPIVTCPF